MTEDYDMPGDPLKFMLTHGRNATAVVTIGSVRLDLTGVHKDAHSGDLRAQAAAIPGLGWRRAVFAWLWPKVPVA